MKLKVLGSGSSGNCYILENDSEALIIEAGLPFREVKKALDFNVRKIAGVVVSHCHLDHSRSVAEYEKAGIAVYKPFEYEMPYNVYGKFFFKHFKLVHDVPCYGFYISHPDMGNLIYASDTEYIKYRFKGLNHILVEANYSKELVDRDSVKYKHQITGHMEISTTCEFIEANRNPALRNVILLHLSEESGSPEEFQTKAEKMVDCPVYVASKGLEVDLRLVPF